MFKFVKFTLLSLAAFLVMGFSITVNADTFVVPDDFPTIQAAVDAANPAGGDIVMVGPGEYAGAVITNPVKIIGSGDATRITSGTYISNTDAFLLLGNIFDLNGTEISNLEIEFDGLVWGIVGYLVDNVTISNVTIKNANRAIDLRWSNNWTVVHNTIDGLWLEYYAHVVGIGLIGTSSDNLITHNYIHHKGVAVGLRNEIWTGIGLVWDGDPLMRDPLMNNNVHHNQVDISVPDVQCYNFVLADYGAIYFGLPIVVANNRVHHNRSWGECAGVSFFTDEVENYNKLHHNKWAN